MALRHAVSSSLLVRRPSALKEDLLVKVHAVGVVGGEALAARLDGAGLRLVGDIADEPRNVARCGRAAQRLGRQVSGGGARA